MENQEPEKDGGEDIEDRGPFLHFLRLPTFHGLSGVWPFIRLKSHKFYGRIILVSLVSVQLGYILLITGFVEVVI